MPWRRRTAVVHWGTAPSVPSPMPVSTSSRPRLRLLVVAAPLLLGLVAEGCRSQPTATTTTVAATDPPTTVPTTTTSTTTTTTLPPTTTTEPLVTQGASVMIANASKVQGAATELGDALAALGFEMRPPTNGWGPGAEIDVTKVYWREGGEQVAASVARLLGLQAERMPTPVWIVGGPEALGDALVLVTLGRDLAGKGLANG